MAKLPKSIRKVICDHAMLDPKKHPPHYYLTIGNLIIGCCLTCYNAITGQILQSEIIDKLDHPVVIRNAQPMAQKRDDMLDDIPF